MIAKLAILSTFASTILNIVQYHTNFEGFFSVELERGMEYSKEF